MGRRPPKSFKENRATRGWPPAPICRANGWRSTGVAELLGKAPFDWPAAAPISTADANSSQPAVCKHFKAKYRVPQDEFYKHDFRIADAAIRYAQQWNEMCEYGREILVTRGDVMVVRNQTYLVEPWIRYFEKFTSNNGWILSKDDNPYAWKVELLEAFCHFTYHKSGGQLIVCDLQGRYKHNDFSKKRCRFELTDPAICSRRRSYGPTDMGEKGIETFFYHHVCNRFCNVDGQQWARPRDCQEWFDPSSNTSMLRMSATKRLQTSHPAKFSAKLEAIYEAFDEEDYESEDDSVVSMK